MLTGLNQKEGAQSLSNIPPLRDASSPLAGELAVTPAPPFASSRPAPRATGVRRIIVLLAIPFLFWACTGFMSMRGHVSGDGSFGLALGLFVSLALTPVLFRVAWLMKVELICISAGAAFYLGVFAGMSLAEFTIPRSFGTGTSGIFQPHDVLGFAMGIFTGGLTAILVTRSLVQRLFLFQTKATAALEIAYFVWLAVSCLMFGGWLILALGSVVSDGVTVSNGLAISILFGCLAAVLAVWKLARRWLRSEKNSGHLPPSMKALAIDRLSIERFCRPGQRLGGTVWWRRAGRCVCQSPRQRRCAGGGGGNGRCAR